MEEQLQLGQVTLNVNELDKVSAFYEQLGFKAQKVKGTVVLSLGINPLIVLQQTNLPRKNEVGLYHLGLKVPTEDDLSACYLYLKNKKIPILGTSKYPCMKSIYFKDPENNGLELYADLPLDNSCLDHDERAIMNPLDLKQLVKESEKPASPLPNDTVIGRIHLHVLKLSDSEVYYEDHLGLTKTYEGKNNSFLSKFYKENYIGLNTWLPGSPTSKNPLSPGLCNFTIHMKPSLFDELYSSSESKIMLIDPSEIQSTVYRGL